MEKRSKDMEKLDTVIEMLCKESGFTGKLHGSSAAR